MSLADLTRNCFQSGVSPTKWSNLCSLYMSKNFITPNSEEVEQQITNSILVLYLSYPGDPGLQEYLRSAISDRLISLAVFVATFLQAARSIDFIKLQSAATLDMLCRVALDVYYSSGLPPVGSIVSFSASPAAVMNTVQDALTLLRTAHSLPPSHFHQVATSASELLVLVLSCITDMSQVSTTQAAVHSADVNELLQNYPLSQDVRTVMETFALSLSLLIGDDAKAAHEAQMLHTIQLAFGKGDILEPSSNSDMISFGLLLQDLVHNRATPYGAGSNDPVVFLLATLRWSAWAPNVFYVQLLTCAFTLLSQASQFSAWIWSSFILGRFPEILAAFEKVVTSDTSANADWRTALHTALSTVLRRSDLMTQCDAVVQHAFAQDSKPDAPPRSVLKEFIRQLMVAEMLDQSSAIGLDATISEYSFSRLREEAQENGFSTLEAYLSSKMTVDASNDDLKKLVGRIWRDPSSHGPFARMIMAALKAAASTSDVDSMSHFCKVLQLHDSALDIVSFHCQITELVFYGLSFVDSYDVETVGDPQTAVTHLGEIVLFLQDTTARFHLESRKYTNGDKTVTTDLLRGASIVIPIEELSKEDATAFGVWFKALFDNNSEGIEDGILRSTNPKALLRIASTLFAQAIALRSSSKMENDLLHNGISYFAGPLLNWTLVGVFQSLIRDIQVRGFAAPVHLEVLQTLILSPSCPRVVLRLCMPQIMNLCVKPTARPIIVANKFDWQGVGRRVTVAMHGADRSFNPKIPWQDQSKHAIRNALGMARSGKMPYLDVDRCLRATPALKFLQFFWAELVVAASHGEMEACRRLATFVLTMRRSVNTPPLLPIFLHGLLPALLGPTDVQLAAEQTVVLELLVSVLSSALTAALHLEWAMNALNVPLNQRHPLGGQPSSMLARRLAINLRTKKGSNTATTLIQRLASTQPFAGNFPTFVGELGL
ncbi:hypothetical protein HGRIS_007828 [Hohenbuehelia grisea]|uniref:Mediator of RNA polymerase II transcription subunit 5 n=1 Tax=Hohenbuehelia grisea TaxID=104357 RepID=A0ABR3J6I5_9AGAR